MASPVTGWGRRHHPPLLVAVAALVALAAAQAQPQELRAAAAATTTLPVMTSAAAAAAQGVPASPDEPRQILGSSVVTSVSVVADPAASNASSTRTYGAEAAGPSRTQQQGPAKKRPQKPQASPQQQQAPATVGSPAGLMSPDRYEFYTFDETGDLVRRHMTLDEIKSLLAGGDGDLGDTPIATFYHGPVPAPATVHAPPQPSHHGVMAGLEDPEDALEDAVKGVQDVVNNVQNVLKSQLAASKNKLPAYIRPPAGSGAPSPSEAAATWGMILPGIMDGGLPPRPASRPTSRPSSRPATTTPAATAAASPTTAAPTSRPPVHSATKGASRPTTAHSTLSKKPSKKPATTAAPAASKEEPTRFTLPPNGATTTEQDVVDTLYTLVSSSPTGALKHTASNNASRPVSVVPAPAPLRAPIATPPPLRPAARPSRPPSAVSQRPTTARPARPTTPIRAKPSATKNPNKTAAKPTASKPLATKAGTRPPKPTTYTKTTTRTTSRPFKPVEEESSVQQRHPVVTQQQAESMVQIVTIQRPTTTTTMAPFVTFIPTEAPVTTPTPTTPPPTSRRPPAISYTYRATSTETPAPTETVSSADLDMDSRTTDEEEEAATATTTASATTSVTVSVPTSSSSSAATLGTSASDQTIPTLGTSASSSPSTNAPLRTSPLATALPTTVSTALPTALPTTMPTALPTIWTTAPPRTTTGLPPTKMTTMLTTLMDSEEDTSATSASDMSTTDAAPAPPPSPAPAPALAPQPVPAAVPAPVRYTEMLTRVPASALVTKRVPEEDEQASTAATTFPTTERATDAMDEAETLMTTSSRPVAAVTVVTAFDTTNDDDEDGDDVSGSTEQVSSESAEAEATTKLYLKISSSETGMLYSTPSTTTEAREAEAEAETSTTEAETRPSASSWETVTDQSVASTEQRATTVSVRETTSAATSSEEPESRTESADLDTTSAEAVSTVPSTAVPTVTPSSTQASSTAGQTSPATSTSSLDSPTAELSLESSNIQTSQVNAPGTNLRLASTTTAGPVDVDANKVDVETASSPAPFSQPLWTRVPVVSSAEEAPASSEGSVKAGSAGSGPPAPAPAAPEPVDEAVKHVGVYHSPSAVELHAAPHEHLGLEAATANLDPDVKSFVSLCNDLAFQMWMAVKEKSTSTTTRSLVMSPFAATSTLAMVFLGARGPTSGQMNDVLRLDDMVSFNPHQVLWNVTESLVHAKNAGVATAALVRELYSDKNKGKLLEFYKERAQQFYDGHVEEITFRNSGDLVRRKTNLLVKRQTRGRVQEYMRGASLSLRPPLAAFGANIFETDCTGASTEGRDGEMHFVVVPSSRQRRLVPVPAVVWRSGFLAGYDPALDATAVALGAAEASFSTVLVLPGQQGHVAPGDGLSRLEQRLLESRGPGARWARLLRTLLPRPGLELQIPRFSHRSVLNMSEALQRMGLDELFSSEHADLRGLNGVANDLHLSDVVQLNTFSTCGERAVDSRHHVEFFPTSPLASPGRRAARGRRLRPRVSEDDDPRIELHPDNVGKDRDTYYARLGDALEAAEARGSSGLTSSEEVSASEDAPSSSSSATSRESKTFQRIADFEDPDLMKVPLALRPRQARIPEAARLRFDRPFLFFVRHNPTGVLLHMGRFNPRLLP